MRVYETIFVLDSSLDDGTIQKEIEKVERLIINQKGRIIKIEKWGTKKFTYPIKKKLQGYYTLIYFEGDGNIPTELERIYKLNEFCLRYLTVVSEEEPERLKAKEKEEDQKEEVTSPE
ncbi:MAG: 30S ribosomal protein S6 [candidate division Zixibacteria bacterium]|nr:30S ribosomal protein S6 [candidate division Zixibacteria bacterium]